MIGYLLILFQRNERHCGEWLATDGVDTFCVYISHWLVLVVVLEAIGFLRLNHWLIALAAMVLGIIISF